MRTDSQVKKVSKEYFNSIAEEYDESHDGKYVKCMYDEIVTRVQCIKGANTILDLGCGNGNVLAKLTSTNNAHYYGIDLSEQMVREARKRLGERATIMVGDAEQLPYENHMFDVIICNASFHHYPNPIKVISEIRRVLKTGGTLVLGDPTAPFRWYLKVLNWFLKNSNSGDYHVYDKREITTMLHNYGFEVQDFKQIEYRNFILNAIALDC